MNSLTPAVLVRALLALLFSTTGLLAQQGGTPLKVFILAGQSNMVGHGEMQPVGTPGTLEYVVATKPGTYGHLKDGGNWATRDDVWISYRRGGTTLLNGDLSAGFGASSDTIGPELQFGFELGDYLGEQVLLIKTAWGGKSLRTDFRPPSSGWDLDPPVEEGDQGYYYQQMLADLNNVLANLESYFPGYDASGGYELAGFGWHQGWNDRVNAEATAEYEANMENFIRDVRTDLGEPALPFVIATTGMAPENDYTGVEQAQLAMEDFTKYPAFDGNVAVVDTREFWRVPAESPQDQGYHWNRNAESYFLIGQSMATHMRVLLEGGDSTPPNPDPMTWATPPTAAGEGEITMTASTATDIIGVEYFFESTTVGGNDSGWQDSTTYTDTGLNNSTSYSYRVKARDESPDANETGWSPTVSATTTPADITPPTPNPMTWAQVPTALSSRAITMTASTASDPSGVEYYFTNTTIMGHDSGWQDSPEFTDLALDPATTYIYTVKARDKAAAQVEGTPSAETAATTQAPPPTGAAIYEPFDDPDATLNGNTPGTGLTGTWNGSMEVREGSLAWGALATSGNRARKTGTTGFSNAGVDPGATLTNLALLEDGSELWFSALMVSVSSGRSYLTFGTGNADGFDRIGGNSGAGLGVRLENGKAFAHGWSGGAIKPSGTTVPDGTILVVGKITWGASGNPDVLEVFLPGSDLALPGTVASTITSDFDQATFNTISFAGGTNGVPEIDEIRFGASYADVVPAAISDDYSLWADLFPDADLTDPDADHDGDGLTNNEERLWGLDPTSGASVNPISTGLDATTGSLTYTRRSPALNGASYTYEWSSTLATGDWTPFTPADESSDGGSPVESVTITLPADQPTATRLFVRVVATSD